MRYVMSDIHGQGSKFFDMLKLINFNDKDTLYILGDVIDRGKDSINLLKYIMKKKNIIMTLGNHEDFLIESYKEGICVQNIEYVCEYLEYINSQDDNAYKYNVNNLINMANWINNGGLITAYQLLNLPINERLEIVNYLNNLPLYIELDKYLLVHAGINCLPNLSKWEDIKIYQTKNDLIWNRKFVRNEKFIDKTIIFGHTPTKKITGKYEILKGNGKIDIDCAAAYGGKLACLCLDNFKEYYI